MLNRDEHENRDWFATSSEYSLAAQRSFVPPRLYAVDSRADDLITPQNYDDPGATQPLGSMKSVALRFPAELVRLRAMTYTQEARSQGVRHSMRLWKDGYEEAFTSLVHESLRRHHQASCELLSWQQEGEYYIVFVAFEDTPLPQHRYH